MPSKRYNVTFQPEGKRTVVCKNSSIMDAAKLLGVDLITICGGEGKCGKCKVIIAEEKGNAGSITEIERSLLSNKELSSGYRLACCAAVVGPLNVIIPEKSRTGKQRLQTEGIDTPVQLEPFIKKFYVKLPSPTLQDSKSDVDRLLNELFSRHQLQNLRVEYDLLMRLPHVLRNEAWKATATVWGENLIIDVDSGDTRDRNYGYAVDIGTTKLAGYLLSLNNGKIIAVGSLMNPQISFGEDLITRISYATKGSEKAKDLQQAVVSGINQILMEICQKVDINPNEIYEMTAVGNTGMHHLFLRLNPKYLSLSPYPPIVRDSLNVEPDKIGVNINPNGNIHFLPVIAGFVGADTVAVILSTEIYKRDELCFAVDIGTNTEIVLGNKNRILACSCASGPAFEGAHITHGMRAATGAIEKVKISPKTFDVQYRTIENAKPRGLCGSALVDIPAEMLKVGIIDVAGTMNRELDTPRLRRGKDGFEFVLAWKKETSTKGDIIVTQKDIRELQLAKGAMHTGASLLMKKEGVTERDIDVAFIAGAFGFYIDPKSARTIGMYPEFQLEKIKMVGNAAGTGARMAIISKNARETAKDISRKVKYVEIAAEPSFHAEFLNSQYLPYADLSKYPETRALLKKLGKYPTKRIPVF